MKGMWSCNRIIFLVLAVALAISVSAAVEDAVINEADDATATVADLPADIGDKNIPGLDTPLPSREQLLQMLDSMAGLSDEEKDNLRDNLLRNIMQEQAETSDRSTLNNKNTQMQALILFSLLSLISLMFAFFFHKLYKSVAGREQKLQQKREMKKLKKNK